MRDVNTRQRNQPSVRRRAERTLLELAGDMASSTLGYSRGVSGRYPALQSCRSRARCIHEHREDAVPTYARRWGGQGLGGKPLRLRDEPASVYRALHRSGGRAAT
jgi:hypothetical protein